MQHPKEDQYSTIHYHSYLQLDKILDAQSPRSEALGKPAHDETLFIIIHQVYELWFKQIIHELGSVMDMFDDNRVDERNMGVAVARLNRIIEIQKLIIDQIRVLETMTPLDFLDFRSYLFPASGFQSFQFRVVEVLLGLQNSKRLTYHNTHYASVFSADQQALLGKMEEKRSMLELVEDWLERTPFLNTGNFDFLATFTEAVKGMLSEEKSAIQETPALNEKQKAMRLKMLGDTDTYFLSVLDQTQHEKLLAEGKLRFSYKATLGALFIHLYRDEPILRMPFELLERLVDIDELFTTWRYRHAQMVLRMLGKKVGTGGSSGFDYLQATAAKHGIFSDLYNISTLLIPRSSRPELPPELKKQLAFHYSVK